MTRFGLFFCGIALATSGCGSSEDGDAVKTAPPVDAGPTSSVDPGDAAPERFPAFAPETPQLQNHAGAVLDSPKIVTVTWAEDPNRATVEQFDDAIGTSDYWKLVKEYGVGPATSDATTHVEVTDPAPGSISEDALASFVATNVEAGTGWPGYDPENIYIVYVPESTMVTDGTGADACESVAGYHDEITDSNVSHLAYAVVLEGCRGDIDVVDWATEVASHELAETSTDPHSSSDTGWVGFDLDHLAWEVWQERQDEVADACEFYDDANYQENGSLAYTVQRLWSNTSAAAGHAPCVRAPSTPYFNTTPLGVEPIDVTLQYYKDTMPTKGFHIPVGSTKMVHFGFYSDAPTAPWTFQVVEGDGLTPLGTSHLTISTITLSGKNGDTADVSITVNSVGNKTGILMTAISVIDGQSPHYMPVLVGAY